MHKPKNLEELTALLTESVAVIRESVPPFGGSEDALGRDARRARARVDRAFFKRTYFPHYAREAEPEYAGVLREVCARRNRPQLLLGFRGCGKSTDISLVDALHEIVFGTARFFIYISRSSLIAAAEYLVPIRAELLGNQRLRYDFGSIAVEGGEMDFVAGETRVLAGGIKSSYRGKKHRGYRPDRIRIEDLEDNTNRMNPRLIRKYIRVLHDDILQAVGSGKKETWSVIFLANYFSKRSLVHEVRTSGQWQVTILKSLRRLREGESIPYAIDGEVSTWEDRYPTAELIERRLRAPVSFAIEWQQEPQDDEGVFRREWFRYVQPEEVPPDCARIAWVDPSPGERGAGDYKAYGVADFAVERGELYMYLIDVRIRQETVNEMLEGMFEMHRRHPGIRVWGYESVGSEYFLEKLAAGESARAGVALPMFAVMKNIPGFVYKKHRIPQMQAPVEKGLCLLAQSNTDTERLIQHYLDFPGGEHDDGADMHSGLYKLGESMLLGQGILA